MKKYYITSLPALFLLLAFCLHSGSLRAQWAPTDTVMWNDFSDLPGTAFLISYNFANGYGYFFGTNYLDLDQDPSTPEQPGTPAFAQGFPVDAGDSYHIVELLFLVGYKEKNSTHGTPLIASIQLLDDSSRYTINTAQGPQSYSVGAPGTHLTAVGVPWDDIKVSTMTQYHFTSAVLPAPVEVSSNYAVVIDLFDFYNNGDMIGFMGSSNGGSTMLFGEEFTLWQYPDPLLWIQVTHLYTGLRRAVAIFPVIDDGTSGIEEDEFLGGMKLGYAYPNPTRDKASILYASEKSQDLELVIVNQNGAVVKQKHLPATPPGEHTMEFNVAKYGSGNYYLIITNGKENITRKMQVIK